MVTPVNKLFSAAVTSASGIPDNSHAHTDTRCGANARPTQGGASSGRPAPVSAETRATTPLGLKKARNRTAENTRDPQRLQTAFCAEVSPPSPSKVTRAQPEEVPKSERIRNLLVEIERFYGVLADFKIEFKEQAVQPVLHSFEKSRERRRRTMHDMQILQCQVLAALELFDSKVVSAVQINAMNERRNEIATSAWALAECEHSSPEILHVSSMSILFEKLAKINSWCEEYLDSALTSYEDVRKQLLTAAKKMDQAEKSGLSPNVQRKELNKNSKAVARASTFLFKSLVPASEVAIQRILLSSALAQMRPEIEERIKAQNAEKKVVSHLTLTYVYEKLMNDARLHELDENFLDAPFEELPSASDETVSESDKQSESPVSNVDHNIDNDVENVVESLQTLGKEESAQTNTKALAQQAQPVAQSNLSSKKRGRRAPRQRSESATSLHHPKYQTMQSLRASQQRKQAVKEVLGKLADTELDKKISVLNFYNAYSALRVDDAAGWKAHLHLLDDARFQLPELAEMRTQLENDMLKFLDNADRDPDADRIFSPPHESENTEMHEKAMLFLTESRAYMTSEANAAYFAYAAKQLGALANQSSKLTAREREVLMLGREIIPLLIDADASNNSPDVPRSATLQPEIFLSKDKCYVEVVDTMRSGSSLYFKKHGFRTSVVRAAELLANAAIGSTRAPGTALTRGGHPSTPLSAAWMQSLAHLAPQLLETVSVVDPFSDTAMQAGVSAPN